MTNAKLRGGGVVMVAGPDGSGKSTLADELARSVLTDPVLLVHHRVGTGRLPRGEYERPVTEPHRAAPYPAPVSWAKAFYLYCDFLIGWLTVIRPFVRSGGWVITQRDWWDLLVDPRRYRMTPIPRLGRLLGRLLPQADLNIVLEAEPEVIAARKAELPAEELSRQTTAWRTVLPANETRFYLDAGRPASEVLQAAAAAVDQTMREKGGSRHAPGWVSLPTARNARWWIPRGPAALARAGLKIHQPVTLKGRLGWEAARALTTVGGFRLRPRGPGPARWVRDALGPYVDSGGSIAVARGNHAGRCVALVIAPDGAITAVAKLATDDAGRAALAREADNLARLAPLLTAPLSAPRLLHASDTLVVMEPVDWEPRWRPWRVPPEVAFGMGAFFRSRCGTDSSGAPIGLSHGDAAPWNLLMTKSGWVLVDWEDAAENRPPFYDLLHYLTQSCALLGRPSVRSLTRNLLDRRHWIGRAVAAYAEGAAVRPDEVRLYFVRYLSESVEQLDERKADGRRGISARRRLLRALTADLRSPDARRRQ